MKKNIKTFSKLIYIENGQAKELERSIYAILDIDGAKVPVINGKFIPAFYEDTLFPEQWKKLVELLNEDEVVEESNKEETVVKEAPVSHLANKDYFDKVKKENTPDVEYYQQAQKSKFVKYFQAPRKFKENRFFIPISEGDKKNVSYLNGYPYQLSNLGNNAAKVFLNKFKKENVIGDFKQLDNSSSNNLFLITNRDGKVTRIKVSTSSIDLRSDEPNYFINENDYDLNFDYILKLSTNPMKNKGNIQDITYLEVIGFISKEMITEWTKQFKRGSRMLNSRTNKNPHYKARETISVYDFFNIPMPIPETLPGSLNEVTITKEMLEKAKKFALEVVEKGNMSEVDYNGNNGLTVEQNKINNSIQGKLAELAYIELLKTKGFYTGKEEEHTLTVNNRGYDGGDFFLPSGDVIDVKAYSFHIYDPLSPVLPFSVNQLNTDSCDFLFAHIDVPLDENNYKDFGGDSGEIKVRFLGYLHKDEILQGINKRHIKVKPIKGKDKALIPLNALHGIKEIWDRYRI